jgi:dienelactone hydrolase
MSDDRDPRLALFEGLQPIERPHDEEDLPLAASDQGAAGDDEVWEVRHGERWVRNVTRPTLCPITPLAGPMRVPAVIIAPGGGFRALAIDGEGYAVARWLARRGIAAFVLKYRLLPTPPATADFYAALAQLLGSDEQPPGPEDLAVPSMALEDTGRAVALVRDQAQTWQVDPQRIGVLGFSAGAMTAIALANAKGTSRPDFIGALYPSLHAQAAPPEAPPLFVAAACDDPLFGPFGAPLLESWRRTGGQLDAHLFSKGGHGFGISPQELPSDQWPRLFIEWMAHAGRRDRAPGPLESERGWSGRGLH